MKRDRVLVDHILECIDWIARHTEGGSVVFARFRNVLVHDYLGISLERVWDVVERDLPVLRAAVQMIQQTLQDDET